ncbi:MAG: uracil phosphoribosyltransferase [Flavobacteriales bacterium]|nr:uracil phosphoribosyltransferase [Flavobacteriales bacterium]
MEIFNLSNTNSLFNHFIAEIRDVNVQGDQLRFRRNLERMGEVIAYEISKKLDYYEQEVTTPLGLASALLIEKQPVIAAILRAALPFHNGMLNYFDKAQNAFISAYRKAHEEGDEIEVEVEYLACPSIEGKPLILADPMLASGTSMYLVYKALLEKGTPSQIHIASAIASIPGIEFIKEKMPVETYVWCGAIDPELNNRSYIVPGLGDAGDLAFGEK